MKRDDATKGIVLILLFHLFLLANSSFVHALGDAASAWQISLARGLAMFVTFVIACRGNVFKALHTRHLRLQLFRGLLSAVSLVCVFYSFAHLALADAQAINFLRPVVLTAIGALVLGEIVAPRRCVATIVAFCGCLAVISPAFDAWQPAYLVAIAGAALNAAVLAAQRGLAKADRPLTTLGWVSVTAIVCSAPGVVDPLPSGNGELWLLAASAISGTAAVWFSLLAVQYAEASLLAPFEYIKLPASLLIGVLVFGELPGSQTLVGALLILASCVVLYWRERSNRGLG